MKKLAFIFTELFLALFLVSAHAQAISVATPSGSVGGWYKDSVTFTVRHGNAPSCVGQGTSYTYLYTVTTSASYQFASDAKDNPYVSINGSTPKSLYTDANIKCPPRGPAGVYYTGVFHIKIDTHAPSISLSSSSATTSSSSYKISGSASDSQSGIKSVQAFVNGAASTSSSSANFSLTVALKSGSNSVYVRATDVVGHTTNSNTITITRASSSGGSSSGGTTSGGSSNSSNGGSSNSSNSGNGSTNNNSSNSTNTAKTTQHQSSQKMSDKLKSLLPAMLLSLGTVVLAAGLIYFFKVNRPKKFATN